MSQGVLSGIVFKIQTILWFFLALVVFVLWLSVWLMSDPTQTKTKQTKTLTSGPAPLPVYIESYVQMTKEVPPIDFSTVVRDLRNYPDEFKDKKHFEKHAKSKKWTVQVMNVSNNDIITQYLNQRDDRDKFAYFRYHNTNGELRYILTYDTMNSAQEALMTIKNVNFGLPGSVKLKAEEIGYYVKIMDSYERGGIFEYSDNLPIMINLKPASQTLTASPIKSPLPKTTTPNTGVSVDNKYQNATPTTPATPVVGSTVPMTNANANTQANAKTSAQTGTPQATKSTTAPKPAPKPTPAQEVTEVTQEISLDNRPKAPPAPPQPPESAPTPPPPSQNEVYYGVRPNTNTNSIPGADRD